MIKVNELMNILSNKRPIFQSEADFQHAFAWELQTQYPKSKIRLEYPHSTENNRIYLDLWVNEEPIYYAIELKYIKKRLNTVFNHENFQLTSNDAPDQARYDFLKDIGRLEQVAHHFGNTIGFAILLTNEPAMWKSPTREDVNDIQFRFQEGRVVHGELDWGPKTGLGTKKGREILNIQDEYHLQWKDYSNLETKNGEFRYLAVKVQNSKGDMEHV
ncbi:hypothetical protein RZN25_15635 [Bacillaceae bacterium S4-13-56]